MQNTNVYINSKKQLLKLIDYCKATGYCSLDFETNGRPFHHPLFLPTILGISFQPGCSYIIPLAHKESKFRRNQKWKKLLILFGKEVLENTDIVKIAWNAKFEINVLSVYNITMKGRVYDAMLAKYLLKEERPNDLKSNVAIFIPEYAGYDLKGQPNGKKATPERIVEFWSNVPMAELGKYCGLDADLTLRLMMFFERRLIEAGFYQLFRNMMMMGVRVLAESERKGIPIDTPFLDSLVLKYGNRISELEEQLKNHPKIRNFENQLIKQRIKKAIFKIEDEIEILRKERKKAKKEGNTKVFNSKSKSIKSREDKIDRYIARDLTSKTDLKMLAPVNFASPDQMKQLFFESKHGFRFDVVRYTIKDKKETENPSTDESVLEELKPKDKSGFIDTLLDYRGTTKLFSTYIIGMKEKLSALNYIHASFLLHGTVTGRLSSAAPNMQNIPRDTTNSDIKKMFIPPPGMLLLQLDYSQAELRVFAALAKEETMLKWFREGKDIHLSVACDKNKWDYDWAKAILDKEDKNDPNFFSVKTERKYAKTINFGIVYGQTAKKLSLGMECSLEEAEAYLAGYKKQFPGVWKFIQKQHKYVKKHGYVYNLFGRKRRLNNIWSDDWGKSAEAQRQSVNAPIQGAASDFTLFSSILIWEKIQRGELPKYMNQCYTVHDSLGYFVKPEDVHWVVPILESVCNNPETKEWFGFQIDSVRMKVDFEVSHENWGLLKSYHPETNYKKIVKDYQKQAA